MRIKKIENYPTYFCNSRLVVRNSSKFPSAVLQALNESPAIDQFLSKESKNKKIFNRILDIILRRKNVLYAEYLESVLKIGDEMASGIKFSYINSVSKNKNKNGFLFGYTDSHGTCEENLSTMLRKMSLEFFNANVNENQVKTVEQLY